MNFFLVNDDGLRAPGLTAMAEELLRRGHTFRACAPSAERSGSSHSFAIHEVLRPEKALLAGQEAWSLDGSPADCACLGLYLCRHETFDMVISGINNGANMGGACIYSGTVAAAMEASMRGVQAVSSSVPVGESFGFAAEYTLRFALWAIEHPLPRGEIYNLNFPRLSKVSAKGLRAATLSPTFMGPQTYDDVDGGYRLSSGSPSDPDSDDQDEVLSARGFITVTPLTWNFAVAPLFDLPEGL